VLGRGLPPAMLKTQAADPAEMTVEQSQRKGVWAAGELYKPHVGRWPRLVARQFLEWLAVPAGMNWLDVGCGTEP